MSLLKNTLQYGIKNITFYMLHDEIIKLAVLKKNCLFFLLKNVCSFY